MRNESRNELTEETKAGQDVPDRTLKEKIDELINEEAKSLIDFIEDVPQEEMEETSTAKRFGKALRETEGRIDASLAASLGENHDGKIASYVFQCVHDVVMPYYLARQTHASKVSSLVQNTASRDLKARNNAHATLRNRATFAFNVLALLIAGESSAA